MYTHTLFLKKSYLINKVARNKYFGPTTPHHHLRLHFLNFWPLRCLITQGRELGNPKWRCMSLRDLCLNSHTECSIPGEFLYGDTNHWYSCDNSVVVAPPSGGTDFWAYSPFFFLLLPFFFLVLPRACRSSSPFHPPPPAPTQRLNPGHIRDPSHSSDNFGSLVLLKWSLFDPTELLIDHRLIEPVRT